MAGFVEGVDRGQTTLFPALLDDYVAEDNPVRAVDVFVDGLDLDKLGFVGVQPLDTGWCQGVSVMGYKVAEGTWYYDGSVPRRIAILRKEARFASSRFDHNTYDEPTVDESRPVPETKDGYLYYCFPANSGEHLSMSEVKAWADAQPWGPVKWDDEA